MRGKLRLYIDQHGSRIYAHTVRELKSKHGRGKVSRMYRDKSDGSVVHCGYVIGDSWYDMFAPVETRVN